MKNIKKSELNIILKDADPQSIQGEINVDKTKNEFEIYVKGKFLIKEPKIDGEQNVKRRNDPI